jgi:Asp-tRNA(Asn)/Glu-tRNA(Gln) amidotransferase A subunit family amidase
VPYTTIPNDLSPEPPADFDPLPARFGIAFYGAACSESRLIELAYAFEQLGNGRVTPPAFP